MTYVLLFRSVHHVMKVEKLLKEKGVAVDLIPVPREISSDCGVAIEIACEKQEDAFRYVQESGLLPVDWYRRNERGRLERGG